MRVINKHIIITVSIFITFGAFVFGYSLVSMSMMSEVIAATNTLSNSQRDYQLSIITTLLPLGAFLGSFFTQFLVDKIGERKSMLWLDVFGFLVITYQAYFLDMPSLYCTRFLLGVYLGISSGIIPAYLVSISPPEMTGLVGSFNQLLITIGICVGYRMGMSDYFGWASYIQFPAFFCLLRMVCLFFFQFDTLERHYKNNQKEKINQYLALFYENGSIEELEKLRMFNKIDSVDINQKIIQDSPSTGLWGWVKSLTSGAPKAVVMMGLVLAFANQLSGINAILYYAKQIFQHISDSKKALQYTYYLGALQVVVTFFSGFMINKYGRRSLMLVGSSIVVFSLISAFLVQSLFQKSQDIVIALVFLHIIGFSLSLGPVSMVYVAEIMQNISFVVIVIWVLTILVSLFSQVMIKSLGIGKVFLFYGICSMLCLVYMYHHMVESKGLSRQQIVARLESKPINRCVEQEKIRLHEQGGTTAQI